MLKFHGYLFYSIRSSPFPPPWGEIEGALIPFLRPQPPLRYLILAGGYIIFIAAGNIFFIGQLHPPAARSFTLQENGFHFCKTGMVFIEMIPVFNGSFLLAAGLAINKIPEHL